MVDFDSEPGDGLWPALRVIDDQPLEQRAASYVHLYDELRARLEGGDVTTNRG